MHEMAIAVRLLDDVLQVAEANHAVRVDEIQLEVGVLRQVVPAALTMAFRSAAEGTIAEHAVLKIHEERAIAVCRHCECMFLPEVDKFLCPQCGRAEARIVAGNDIILKSLMCETPEEASEDESRRVLPT